MSESMESTLVERPEPSWPSSPAHILAIWEHLRQVDRLIEHSSIHVTAQSYMLRKVEDLRDELRLLTADNLSQRTTRQTKPEVVGR